MMLLRKSIMLHGWKLQKRRKKGIRKDKRQLATPFASLNRSCLLKVIFDFPLDLCPPFFPILMKVLLHKKIKMLYLYVCVNV